MKTIPPLVPGLLVLLTAGIAAAAVIHVPADYPTIGAGIAASSETDTVLVAPGTYSGAGNCNITIQGRSFTLMSEAGAASTVIDGQYYSPAFSVYGVPSSATIEGFTMTNCGNTLGGAIYLGGSTQMRIRNCVFYDNRATVKGGAICSGSGARASFEGCVFQQNEAVDSGGAMYFSNAGSTDLLISDCTFAENTSGSGGAIYCEEYVRISLMGCDFSRNSATRYGGAVCCWDYGAWVTATDCSFVSNVAGFFGGGIHVGPGRTVLSGCLFQGNSAVDRGGAACSFSTFLATECTFIDNAAETKGGALWLSADSYSIVSHCTLVGNSAAMGGGIFLWGFNPPPVMENNIIAFSGAGGAVHDEGQSPVVLACCDLYGNAGGDWTGSIAGQCGQNGNIDSDPLFCMEDSMLSAWTLHSNSPCASANSAGCGTIGVWDVDCGWSGVREASWGQIKALYR